MATDNNIIAIFDIGINTITAAAVEINSSSEYSITILALEKQKFGIALNDDIMPQIRKSFLLLIDKLENKISSTLQHISLSFDRKFAFSCFNGVTLNFHNQTHLKKYHLAKLYSICQTNCAHHYPDYKIIEMRENYFIIDGSIKTEDEIINLPVNSIYGHYHVFLIKNIIREQINEFMIASRMNIVNILPSSYARGISALTQPDKEGLTLFIDIGAAKTAVIMYRDGYPEWIEYLLLGGFHVTKDIANLLSISLENSERIKLLANSIEQNEENFIEISENADLNKKNRIAVKEIRSFSTARVREILSMINQLLLGRFEDNADQISTIIISGGVAKTLNITSLGEEIFKIRCRLDDSDIDNNITYQDNTGLLKENRLEYNIILGHMIHLLKKKKFEEMKKNSNKFINILEKITCFLEEIFY